MFYLQIWPINFNRSWLKIVVVLSFEKFAFQMEILFIDVFYILIRHDTNYRIELKAIMLSHD